MQNKLITLTKATMDDCQNIYSWRNDEINRQYSGNSDVISFDDHKTWLYNTLKNTNKNLLIASNGKTQIGVIRFDYDNNQALISVYLVPGFHGKGYGYNLIKTAENWLKENKTDIKQINAKILEENIASKKIFTRAQYKKTKDNIWVKEV